MKILAIETSCDETAAAVVEQKHGRFYVLSNIVSSQIKIHQPYGGVVPEMAAREHIKNIIPVIDEALCAAGIKFERQKYNKKNPKSKIQNQISSIAVTIGPGLITSLLIGVETAKALAAAWNLPLIPVNHIAGHLAANFISPVIATRQLAGKQSPKKRLPRPFGARNDNEIQYPAITLTVSGGHTLLVLMKNSLNYRIIGDTLDDAAGECFDKAAKMLGLGYPGGPAIAATAAKDKLRITNYENIKLPRPMINVNNLNFSFSGLKTALLYKLRDDKNWRKQIPQYAAEVQQAIIDVLIAKTLKATQTYKAKTVMLTGGVSANLKLRKQFTETFQNIYPISNIQYPISSYTTDNAAMIAVAALLKYKIKRAWPYTAVKVNPNLAL